MRVWLPAVLVSALALTGCPVGDARGPDELPPTETAAEVHPVEQVRAHPHDPNAFTQGLLWHGGRLYESTGRYGESSIRIVDLESGEVRRRTDLGQQYFGEGIAVLDGRLYQLTWQEGVAFVWDPETLREVGRVRYAGEAWGLTTDGESLIVSDGSSYLTWVDPADFSVRRTVRVTDGGRRVDQLNEMDWVRGEIWANVWHSTHIVRIDPATGRVLGRLDLTPLVPRGLTDREAVLNGIAYDAAGDRLMVTGKLWPVLYEISVPALGIGAGAAEAPAAAAETVP
jgi:glutaminyl-peptide cyclotransferase